MLYIYMVTFTINIPPKLVYKPYMDPMGNIAIENGHRKFVDLPIKTMVDLSTVE